MHLDPVGSSSSPAREAQVVRMIGTPHSFKHLQTFNLVNLHSMPGGSHSPQAQVIRDLTLGGDSNFQKNAHIQAGLLKQISTSS